MKKILTARVGGRYVVVPKLIGLLLVLVALLLFVGSTADLLVSWDKIKDVKECIAASAAAGDRIDYLICTVKAASVGVYPFGDRIDHTDIWAVMSQKAAIWVFWVLLLVVALVIYQSGKLLEFEEEIVETKAEEETEEKKTKRGRKRTKK